MKIHSLSAIWTMLLVFALLVVGQLCFADSTVPSAPTNVQAMAGDGQATVSFAAPMDDGGSPIISYIVISGPGVATVRAIGQSSPIIVTGLTNGTTYNFVVMATNSAGTSDASDLSNDVTPVGTPVETSQWQ